MERKSIVPARKQCCEEKKGGVVSLSRKYMRLSLSYYVYILLSFITSVRMCAECSVSVNVLLFNRNDIFICHISPVEEWGKGKEDIEGLKFKR